jgi:hypothetical protein
VSVQKANAGKIVPLHPEPALMRPGLYTLAYVRHTLRNQFNRGVLTAWFRVVDYGDHFEMLIPRYYNVQLRGKKSFRVKPHSHLYREICELYGRRPRLDRLPLTAFQDVLLLGRVKTVTRDQQQESIPEAARYSVVDKILGKVDP